MAHRKCTLYVGGLAPQVTEEILHASFIPFGDLKIVNIPKDYSQNKNKGFGFVEYDEEDDCAAALENMHGSELFGKVLRCAIAKPMMNRSIGTAIWTAEDWIQNNLANADGDDFDGDDTNLVEAASLKPTE